MSLNKPTFAVIVAVLLGAGQAVGIAQESDRGRDSSEVRAIEEVLVTARKREENLQDVPIAITHLDSKQLEQSEFSRASELQAVVPNLTIAAPFGSSNPVMFLRGVGNVDFNDNASSTVGTYLDDVFLNSPSGKMLQMFDLESVQVLRGPQGTLFGKNNTGGAVTFVPVKPGDEVEGYFRSTAGNYQKADIEAAVTVPLTDSISSRIAFQKNNRGGYADSLNEDGSLREKVGRLDELAARAIFRWQADNTEVTLNLNFSDADNDRSVGKATNTNPDGSNALGWIDSYPNDPRIVAPNYKEIEVAKTKGAFLNVVHDWENVSLTSISAYYHAERFVTLDVDHSPVNLLQLSRFPDSDQFSQEIRLTSRGEHDIDWILGAYYFTEDVTVNNLFTFFDLSVEPFIPQVFSSDTDTLAVFAESIFHLSDRTSITAGARFTHDERDFSLDFGGAPVATGLEDSWDEVSWRGVIDYQFSESAMVYGSISHGFQGGGFNGGAFSEAEVGDGFDPEFLTAYELGVKSHLLGGRLTANAAIFYYDYKDPQVFTIDAGQAQGSTGTGLVQTIVNADSAKIYGAELEMVALIDDSTRMSGSIGLLDTSYGPLDLLGPGGEIISGDGNRLAGAPEYDVTFAFDKRVSLSSGFVMFHVDYNHRSKMYFDITQRELISEPSYGIANARVSYSNNAESIEVALWAKNILDEEVRLWVADVSSSFNITEDIYNLPRTYGIDFIYRF